MASVERCSYYLYKASEERCSYYLYKGQCREVQLLLYLYKASVERCGDQQLLLPLQEVCVLGHGKPKNRQIPEVGTIFFSCRAFAIGAFQKWLFIFRSPVLLSGYSSIRGHITLYFACR